MHQIGVWVSRMMSKSAIDKHETHFDGSSSFSTQKKFVINDKDSKLNESASNTLHLNGTESNQRNYGNHEDLIQRSRTLHAKSRNLFDDTPFEISN